MKKLLTSLLCVVMVMCFMPSMAWAGSMDNCTATDCGHVAKIDNTHYDTLQEAVTAAKSKTGDTVVTVLKDVKEGGGVIAAEGTDVTIDFAGHTYTVTHDFAGSSKTQTQCFQLLKNSNITFKDGTIVAGNSGIKMIIQNYSNLILDGMTLDATTGTNSVGYVLSNNNGNTVITGDTSIKAKEGTGCYAFDVYYWPSGGYENGVSVTIDKDMTGTIHGDIQYAADSKGIATISEKAFLNIEAGTVEGSINTKILEKAGITISGGTFPPTAEIDTYVVEGMTKDETTGKVVVDTTTAVAEVNGVGYISIANAVQAAGTDDVVKLVKDVVEDVVIPTGKTITLDLNSKKLTNASSDTIAVKIGASLTVTGEGTVDNITNQKGAIFNEGKVVLKGGTYDRSLETGKKKTEGGENTWYTICNHGEMEIYDGVTVQTAKNNNELGKFSSLLDNGYASYDSNNSRSGYVNGTNAANPKLTINGGTFQGGLNTIKNDDAATLTIENGTFKNFYQAVVQNHNVATINGGTFTAAETTDETYGVYNCGCAADHDLGTLTITDGTFTGADYAVIDVSNQSPQVKISGGTFEGEKLAVAKSTGSNATYNVSGGAYSSDVPEDFLASDKDTYKKADGKFIVENETAENAKPTIPNTPGYEWVKENGSYVEKPVYVPSVPTTQKPIIESADNATVTLSTDGTQATIKVADGYELVDVTVNGVSKGKVDTLTGLKTGDKVVVTTKKIDTTADEIAAVKATKLVARSANAKAPSGKKAIKVYWFNKDGSELNFDGYEVYRSTKKNKFGKKPIYTAKKTQYFNTSAKKGTRYYYKVRGYKVIGGEKVYTDFSLKAIRTAR